MQATYGFSPALVNASNAVTDYSVGTIWMTGTSGAITLSGNGPSNGLSMTGATVNGTDNTGILVDNTSANSLTITARILLSNSQSWINNSSNVLTVSGNTLMGNNKVLTIDGTGNTTISTAIIALGGLVKNGTGTLILSNAGNYYAGGTTINGGTVKLGSAVGASREMASLTFGGNAIFDVAGFSPTLAGITINAGAAGASLTNTATTGSKVFGLGVGGIIANDSATLGTTGANGLSLNAATGAQTWSVASGKTLTLAGALTRSANGGAVVNLVNNGGTFAAGFAIANSSGIIGGWMTVGGADWATKDVTGNLTALAAYDSFAAPGTNRNILQTDAGTVSASTSVNTLKVATTQAGQSLAVTGALTLSSGGLLFTGTQDYAINGGTLMGKANDDLILNNTGTGVLTVGSTIANNGTSGLLKAGNGKISLAAANTFTGAVTVLAGTLSIDADQSVGTGAITLGSIGATNAVTLNVNGNTTATGLLVRTNTALAQSITIAKGKTLTINGNIAVGSNIAGAGQTTTNLTVSGSGTLAVRQGTAGAIVFGDSTTGSNFNDFDGVTVDLSGLRTFTVDKSGATDLTSRFYVGNATGASTSGAPSPFPSVTVKLAPTTTITTGTIAITNNGVSGGTVTLQMVGSDTALTRTTLNAATVAVNSGNRRSNTGILNFSTGSSGAQVKIRGYAGLETSKADMTVAVGRVQAAIGTVDFAGHYADLLLGTLTVGGNDLSSSAGGAMIATLGFNMGRLNVDTLKVATMAGASTNTGASVTSTVTLGGGTTTVNNQVILGQNANTLAGASGTALSGTLTITSGIVNIANTSGTSILMADNATTAGVATAAGTPSGTLNINGGVTTLSGKIVKGGGTGAGAATVSLGGGTLDLGGNTIGDATNTIVLTLGSGILKNVSEINGGGAVTKGAAGTLLLSGSNSYTGKTTISAGVLSIDTIQNAGSTTGNSLGTPAAGANSIIDLGTAATLQYVGSAAGSSNRVINLTTAAGGTFTLDASGTATFALSGGVTTAGTTNTSTLALTGTGSGSQSGSIVNGTGTNVTAMAKSGSGTWVLSGANTNTGTTTLTRGILRGTQTSGTPFGKGAVALTSATLAINPDGTGSDVAVAGANNVSGTLFTYNAGAQLALNKGTQNSLTYTIGGGGNVLTRGTTGTLIIGTSAIANLGATTAGGGERVLINGTAPALTNNMVGSSIVGQNGSSGANLAGDFLTYGATNGFAVAAYTATNTFSGTTSASLVNISSNTSTALTSAAYALKTSAIVNNTGNTLTLGASGTTAGLILNGGAIQGGSLATASNVEATVYTSAANGSITANLTTNSALTTFGPGTLTLGGTTSGRTSAATAVNSGVLKVLNQDALYNTVDVSTAKGTVTVAAEATLSLAGTMNFTNTTNSAPGITLADHGATLRVEGGNSVTYARVSGFNVTSGKSVNIDVARAAGY